MNGEIISIENAKKTAKYEKALRVIKIQKDEINELKRTINQTIEYIYELKQNAPDEEALDKLLKILKGENNE